VSAPRIPPRLLTIAGSDSGGGAGIQADLKTFAAHGVYGMSAITALTAQNTLEVRAVLEVPPEMVAAQIDAVLEDIGVDGVKIGMLANAAIVRAVAARLRVHLLGHSIPVVLDPVMVAKSGDALLRDDAVEAMLTELLPLCTVVTPNLPELARMTGRPVATEEERLAAAADLSRRVARTGAGLAVLAKGGHGEGDEVVDLLLQEGRVERYAGARLAARSSHGTGCTLSSALAARLAGGTPLPQAVEGAIAWLRGALAAAYPLGGGTGPVDHLYQWRKEA
jgi:hydroxymethylpyrimidine/phosphomethylpyrimidine kinase